MEQWYCLYTKPNAEYLVTASLEWRGLETYFPLLTVLRSKRKGKRPFFPCYLFLRVDFEVVDLSSVRWTPGLRSIINFNNEPAPLSDELISNIQSVVESLESSGGLPAYNFNQGDKVRIINGPFNGLEAIFDEPQNVNKRVRILLEILGQQNPVTIDVNDLERMPEVSIEKVKRLRRTRGKQRRINTARQEILPPLM